MNGKKRNLITDTEAVSGAIGAVLMIAIFVTLYTMLQATAVPMWNKQVERAHMPIAYDDMMTLKSDIEDVATLNVTKSSDINLGARYPDRMIFRNPGPGAYGTLTVEGNVSIEIDYDGNPPQIINSRRITYELYGMTPKIVYEHGILIRDYGNDVVLGPIRPDNHSLYDKAGNLYIPIVNLTSEGEDCFSTSSLDSTSLTIFPYPRTEEINPTLPVTITLATNYSTVWDDILVDNAYTTASVTGDRITLVNTATEQLYLPEYDEEEMYKSVLYSGIAQPYKIPSGSGGAGGGGGVGGNITEDTSSIYVSTGDDEVLGLNMTNDGDQTIAIEFMRLTWTPDLGEYVSSIKLNTVTVTGSSAIHADSEMWIALTDDGTPPARLIDPGETINVGFDFGGANPDMHEKYVTIECLLSDGSIKTITFTTPSE